MPCPLALIPMIMIILNSSMSCLERDAAKLKITTSSDTNENFEFIHVMVGERCHVSPMMHEYRKTKKQ